MDDCTCESLAVYADFSISGDKVAELMQGLVEERGDNGPEFLSKAFTLCCGKQEISICYIQTGKPIQNGYIERLNAM